jgi:hypothetical protein
MHEIGMPQFLNRLDDPHFAGAALRIPASHELYGDAFTAGRGGFPNFRESAAAAQLNQLQARKRPAPGFEADAAHEFFSQRK